MEKTADIWLACQHITQLLRGGEENVAKLI